MAVNQWQAGCRRRSVTYLTVWLVVSIWVAVIPTSDCQNAVPSQHGLMYEKSSGEASGAMMAFFDHPVAKPEALPLNVKDPMWKPAAARAADPAGGSTSNGGHTHRSKTSASVIAGSTIAAGLIVLGVVAAAAYMVRARRTNRLRAAGSSQSLEEVRLGAAV